MYPAMVLMVLFVALLVAIHESAPPASRAFSLLGLCVGVVAAAVLLIDYYLQVTVMQPSLEKGQLDGWAMLTMYNPNGVFIALEELGDPLMSLVFLCLAPVFVGARRLERALRWLSSRASPRRSSPWSSSWRSAASTAATRSRSSSSPSSGSPSSPRGS